VSSPTGAVFLSYASEDSEAAARIAQPLEAADIQVWFDRSALRGGDAWDASIRQRIRGCALFIATPDGRSIAVLPFVNMSSEPDQEYFSDGLAEEIINLLARAPDLKVIARTSSFSFRGKEQDVRRIADILGVTHVLEG
jgi:TIR domain-containing protein